MKHSLYNLLKSFTELSIITLLTTRHLCNYLIVRFQHISQLVYIFNYNDASVSFHNRTAELHLMVIYMLVVLMLTWHNNGRLTNLQRHNETCRTP